MNLENTDKCSKKNKTNFTPQNHLGIVLYIYSKYYVVAVLIDAILNSCL